MTTVGLQLLLPTPSPFLWATNRLRGWAGQLLAKGVSRRVNCWEILFISVTTTLGILRQKAHLNSAVLDQLEVHETPFSKNQVVFPVFLQAYSWRLK